MSSNPTAHKCPVVLIVEPSPERCLLEAAVLSPLQHVQGLVVSIARRPVRSVHGQNYAKGGLPSHHLCVGLRRLVERDCLDHGGHAAQRTETERSVSSRRVSRQGTFELAAPEYEIHT